jgi:putative endopeptidase
MRSKNLKPLVIAASITLALPACGRQGQPAVAPAPAPTSTVAPEATTAKTTIARPSNIFDVSELDSSINACQDFNGFVNAKWRAANPIPSDHASWGPFAQLAEQSLNTQHEIVEKAAKNADQAKSGSIEQKIGWLYQAGMDQDAINKAGFDPLKPQLDQIAALKTPADIARYIIDRHVHGSETVFGFGSSADYKDARLQIGFVSQGGLILPTPDYYTDPKQAEMRQAYKAYIVKTLELTGVSDADAKKQADDVLSFETQLAKVSLSPTELRDPDNNYHFVSVTQADKITPHFSWDKYFAAQNINVGKGFSLSQPKFIAEFDKLLVSAPISQWQAYFRFHAINGASPYLSTAFQANVYDFYGKTLSGQPERPSLWKRVLSTVNQSMGEALGQLYVAKEFTPEAKQRAVELVTNVRQALKEHIQNSEWMSDATKQKALDKWNKFLPNIGYPSHWRSWDGLDIKQGDYYGDVMAANKFNHDWDIGHIGESTDREEWSQEYPPQIVQAYYEPTTNTISFNAAILQPPFFYANGDDAINYGAIGAVIGHEASHGFDDEGSQFDGDGNKVDWWTTQDEAQFKTRSGKLIDQFNGYAPMKDKPDLHVNGQLTLGENIADLGGLNVAYDALQNALKKNPTEANEKIDGYTQDQRYFLSWARIWRENIRTKLAELHLNNDPHSPAKFRAIGAPSNMPAFANAFQCKPTDPMVRPADKQVKIW